jgi:hypothetical protein
MPVQRAKLGAALLGLHIQAHRLCALLTHKTETCRTHEDEKSGIHSGFNGFCVV